MGNPTLIPGTNLIIPNREEETYVTYTVKAGDTIYDIARRNNIDRRILLLINGLDEEYSIRSGSVIIIPYYGEV
jgi:LysM repeat protein